jgi:hypothetical protein
MKIDSETDHKISKSPNLYSLFLTKEKENILDNLDKFNTKGDEDFSDNFEDYENGNIFIMDAKLKQERDKRLNEKDKFYKIKKHYFLKKSYSDLADKEIQIMKLEMIKEKVYFDFCFVAEEKLKNDKELNMTDIYYLLKRNYPLLNKKEKAAINHLQNLHFAFKLASATSSIILVSYVRSIMVYFKFEIFRRKIMSYFLLGAYGIGIYLSIMHFVEISHKKKLKYFYLGAKERILDPANEVYKTPYNEDEKTYNAEEKLNAENIFKF